MKRIGRKIGVLLLLAVIAYWFYQAQQKSELKAMLEPFLSQATVAITSTETRVVHDFDVQEMPHDQLSQAEGSSTVFLNHLQVGQKVKIYRFFFEGPYHYKGIDVSHKWCDDVGFVCHHFFQGIAYVDDNGQLRKLKIVHRGAK